MKKTLFLIFFITSIFTGIISSNMVYAEDSESCKKYKDEVDDKGKSDQDFKEYCNNLSSCEQFSPTKDSINELKIKIIPFVPVITDGSGSFSVDSGELYKTFLQSILQSSTPFLGIFPLDQAKTVYLETQNAIYNCAVLKTKIKVSENVTKLLINASKSNETKKIENQIENLKNELSKRKCNELGDKVKSEKEVLLQNVTYHYCNYRFYLNYLNNFPQYNVISKGVSSKVISPAQDKMNVSNIYSNTLKQANIVNKEITHAKEVYNKSFNAFTELESTYGIHIMLMLIYDDYVQIRNNLEKVLAPISQLAYKIPQAQNK